MSLLRLTAARQQFRAMSPAPTSQDRAPEIETRAGGPRLARTRAKAGSRFLYGIVLAAVLIPAIYIASLVRRYGVNVPLWDDWDMVPMIVDAHEGDLKFADLFAQQLEARTLIPKLLFILFTFFGRFDARDGMMFSVVVCALTAGGIFMLLRRSGLSLLATTACFVLVVLSIFSPAQEELWLLASGFPSFMPVAFILAGLLIVQSRASTLVKFVSCAALSIASTFTLAHGLLAFGLTFPVMLAWERPRRWFAWLAAWGALGAAFAVIYFWGYTKPPEVPAFAPDVPFADYLRYGLIFLGGGLVYGLRPTPDKLPLTPAMTFGIILLVLLAAAATYVFVRRNDRDFLRRTVPWIALALYSVGCAIPASLGRVGIGVQQALDSRYVTFSMYLTIALIGLGAIFAMELMRSPSRRTVGRILGAGCAALALLYVGLYTAGFTRSVSLLEHRSARYRLGRAGVLFSQVLDTSAAVKMYNSTRPAAAKELADQLDKLNLLDPPLIRSKNLLALPHEAADGDDATGKSDRAAPIDTKWYGVGGWAALLDKDRPADCAVIAYDTPRGESVAIAISDRVQSRPEVAELLNDEDQLWSGWTVKFAQRDIPPGAKLTAWAFDGEEPMLYRLPDPIPFTPPPDAVQTAEVRDGSHNGSMR